MDSGFTVIDGTNIVVPDKFADKYVQGIMEKIEREKKKSNYRDLIIKQHEHYRDESFRNHAEMLRRSSEETEMIIGMIQWLCYGFIFGTTAAILARMLKTA
jgi:hypothetical protein